MTQVRGCARGKILCCFAVSSFAMAAVSLQPPHTAFLLWLFNVWPPSRPSFLPLSASSAAGAAATAAEAAAAVAGIGSRRRHVMI